MQRGRARFELDGESIDAPADTFVFVRPGAKRTAFAEEAGTTIIALGGTPGKAYQPTGFEIWAPLAPLYAAGEYAEVADRGQELIKAHPESPALLWQQQQRAAATSPAARASRDEAPTRSSTSDSRSSVSIGSARSPPTTPTLIRRATAPHSRSWWVSQREPSSSLVAPVVASGKFRQPASEWDRPPDGRSTGWCVVSGGGLLFEDQMFSRRLVSGRLVAGSGYRLPRSWCRA